MEREKGIKREKLNAGANFLCLIDNNKDTSKILILVIWIQITQSNN